MTEQLVSSIILNIENASELYYRLILVVAPVGGGKTAILQDVAKRINVPVINVNFEVSRRMLDLSVEQRIIKLTQILEDILAESSGDIVILDNLEFLFSESLKQDPLRLIQRLSRRRIVIASWNGYTEKGQLIYAVPGHPEYQRYPIQDFLLIDIGGFCINPRKGAFKKYSPVAVISSAL